jgi:hypothetical protein
MFEETLWDFRFFNFPSFDIIFDGPVIVGDNFKFRGPMLKYGIDSEGGPWTATITFAAGTSKLTATATNGDDYFWWDVPAAETEELIPGPYLFVVHVTSADTTQRYTLQKGSVVITEDITTATTVNSQSMLVQLLAACDATLLALLQQKVTMFAFAGKQYTLHNIKELYAVRENLWARVQDEKDELEGDLRSRKIIAVFTNL